MKNMDRASKTFLNALSRLFVRSPNLATKDLVAPIKPWQATHRDFSRTHARTIRSHGTTVGRRLVNRYKVFNRNVGTFLRTLPSVLKVAYDDAMRRNQGKAVLKMAIQTLAKKALTPDPVLYTAICNYVKTFGAHPRSKRYIPCLTSRQKWMAKAQDLKDAVCDKSNARFPQKLQRTITAFMANTRAAHVDKALARRIANVTDKAQACVSALLPPKRLVSPKLMP